MKNYLWTDQQQSPEILVLKRTKTNYQSWTNYLIKLTKMLSQRSQNSKANIKGLNLTIWTLNSLQKVNPYSLIYKNFAIINHVHLKSKENGWCCRLRILLFVEHADDRLSSLLQRLLFHIGFNKLKNMSIKGEHSKIYCLSVFH